MNTIKLTIEVPEEYVEDAHDFGMLDSETIAQVLRAELDDRIMKFVDTEVKAYRAEQRAKNNYQEG